MAKVAKKNQTSNGGSSNRRRMAGGVVRPFIWSGSLAKRSPLDERTVFRLETKITGRDWRFRARRGPAALELAEPPRLMGTVVSNSLYDSSESETVSTLAS